MKPAYVAIEDRECYNYGEKGHLSYNVPILEAVVAEVGLVEVVVEAEA
jgi:hypothetical protein